MRKMSADLEQNPVCPAIEGSQGPAGPKADRLIELVE